MNELILIMIMLATVVYVSQPYWRKRAVVNSGSSNGQLMDLIEKRDSLLAQIKELEFDHQVGKVSAEDFAEINARYRTEAIRVLRRIDALNGHNRPAQKLEEELGQLRAQRKKGMKSCSQCGNSFGRQDRFCANCGHRLHN